MTGLLNGILDLAAIESDALPAHSRDLARLSLFDWIICGIGGQEEPVAKKVLAYIAAEAGPSTVFGNRTSGPHAAALANGTISHALDYDDTHFAHIGHLSVAIYPAALAVAQDQDASLNAAVDAFLVGAEAAIRIGLTLGRGHYERGFHQTATAGAFGATVAASRLYGLTRMECRAAIGLCATRASGLKSQFGTMGKPLNAGFAASNGVEAARLAALGVTSADDGLTGQQGFIETHSETPSEPTPPGRFLFDDNRYKLHACCHGTHAMIEAIQDVRQKTDFGAADVQALNVQVNPRWLRVCNIGQPRTGLEVKFSYAWLGAMAFQNVSTADPAVYRDMLCADPALTAFAQKIDVAGNPELSDTATDIVLTLTDGTQITAHHDLMDSIDRDTLTTRLQAKGQAVIGARALDIWTSIFEEDGLPAGALRL